jgi:sugar phosphate isomerase/epimerase
MRLGGSILGPYAGAAAFTAMARECGFRSVAFPLTFRDKTSDVDRLVQTLADSDISVAEVGAWHNNPLIQDKKKKKAAIDNIVRQLELAEYIGAPCCVNVAGSHSAEWDGPAPDCFTDQVFDEVVRTVQEIIDRVKPVKTTYSLETMPYQVPYSADSYAALIRAVNRQAFSVHLDTVNLITSPEKYFANAGLTRECFSKLGKKIKSIHIKDIILSNRLTVHLDECLVGTGGYDLSCLLTCAAKLSAGTPVLVEHIKNQEDYKRSILYLNKLLKKLKIA